VQDAGDLAHVLLARRREQPHVLPHQQQDESERADSVLPLGANQCVPPSTTRPKSAPERVQWMALMQKRTSSQVVLWSIGSVCMARVEPRADAMRAGTTSGKSSSGNSTLEPRTWLVIAATSVPGAA